MKRYALVLALVGVFALPALGAVTLVSAERTVSIEGAVQNGGIVASFSNDATQTDFAPMAESLQDFRVGSYGTVSAMASQSSSVFQDASGLLGGEVASTAAITAATFGQNTSSASAASLLSITFEVTDAVPFSLTGSFSPTGGTMGPWVALRDANTNIVLAAADATAVATPDFLFNLALDPGTYKLESWVDLDVALASNNISQAGSVVYSFVVPEPATLALLALGGVAMLRRRGR